MIRAGLIPSTTAAASPGIPDPLGCCTPWGGGGMLPACPPPKAIAYPEQLPPAPPGAGLWPGLPATPQLPAHGLGRGAPHGGAAAREGAADATARRPPAARILLQGVKRPRAAPRGTLEDFCMGNTKAEKESKHVQEGAEDTGGAQGIL